MTEVLREEGKQRVLLLESLATMKRRLGIQQIGDLSL